MHASLLGCCFESFVVDNDMLGAVLRTVRGIEVTEGGLSLEAIEHGSADVLDHARSRLRGDPRQPLPAPHLPGSRPPAPRTLPDPPARSADAARQRPLARSELTEKRSHAQDANPAVGAEAQ
jgi:hypothetical protein